MEKIKFLVQGSSEEPYEITFTKSGNNLTALCTCPAGQNGMYCKHRFRILSGSIEGIISKNLDEVSQVNSWLSGSDIEEAINELAEAEMELLNAKKKVSSCKKKLARKMYD
jgi:hypothetical protein